METKTVINWPGYGSYVITMVFFILVVQELDIENHWYEGFLTVLGILVAYILNPTTKRIPVH